MASLLMELLRNESGGRNIANTTQGTSSGQAQGFFQITTGTWDEFGGRQYAPDPLHASYEQQADIASKIPLRRWDESTVARMRGTGRPIDPNRTLGENLAANGENIRTRVLGPVEAAGGGAGADQPTSLASAFSYLNDGEKITPPLLYDVSRDSSSLAGDLSSSVSGDSRKSDASTNALLYGAADQEPATAQAFDFSSPPLPETGQAGPAIVPSSDQPLADLFKVRDIGQAATNDPRTGAPVTGRRRRAYG